MNNLLNKVILLSVVCFLSTPIAEFIAENFGSIIGNLFTITRTTQYASSIRMICLILFLNHHLHRVGFLNQKSTILSSFRRKYVSVFK